MKQHITKFLLYLTGLFLIGFALWTDKYFGVITVDQGLSTVLFNTQDAVEANISFTRRMLEWCVLWPVILASVLMFLPLLMKLTQRLLSGSRIGKVFEAFPIRHLGKLLLVAGIVLVWHQYSLTDYIKQRIHPETIISRSIISILRWSKSAVKKTKSLVLIYVESLETTYTNTGLFRNNLLRRLSYLNAKHLQFDRNHEMPGAQWSVAGIISTQCGVPLKLVTMFRRNDVSRNAKTMLPNAICLGDILAEKGYTNVYLNGSSLGFAGVGKFFQDHHYNGIIRTRRMAENGRGEALAINQLGLA